MDKGRQDPNLPTVDELRRLADERIRQQIAQATLRRANTASVRQTLARRRAWGLQVRHRTKQTRLQQQAADSQQKPTDGDDAA